MFMSEEESSQSSQEGSQPKPVCPVPPEHVKLFQDCCDKYQKGEISDIDVMIEVAKTLKGLKKEG